MRKLSDFPLYPSANSSDLLLIWDNENAVTKAIKKSDLLAGISSGSNGSGTGLSRWMLIDSDYTVTVGERLLVDTNLNSFTLTLPSNVNLGDEIELLGIKGLKTNPLKLDFNNNLFNGNIAKIGKFSVLLNSVKLIYTTPDIGWIDLSRTILDSGSYNGQILSDLPYVYLRLNDLSGTKAEDTSINSRSCQYLGNPIFQQESSLLSQPNDKSVKFNGSTRIQIDSTYIKAPGVYALECRFKTPNSYGGLFGFYGGGYDRDFYLTNGKLQLLNYNGATITTSKTYNDDTWHTATAITNSRGTEIWVDGVLDAISTNSNSVIYDGNWFIGFGQYGNYFTGLIDEPSITHGEISQDRIKQRHAAAR